MEHSNLLSTAKLLLEISVPSLEECWSHGYELSSTLSIDDNPFAEGSLNHHHWAEGWWAGFFEKGDDCNNNYSGITNEIASNDTSIDRKEVTLTTIAKNIYNF